MWDNFFSFPHWREDEHAWTRARQHHKAFCENFLFLSSCFAVSWDLVHEFWSKPSNFQIFQKQSYFFENHNFWSFSWALWPKIIKFGKFFIFGRGSRSTLFWSFLLSTVHAFWAKIIKFVIFPKLFLVQNLPFSMVINHEILVNFIDFCL